MVVKLTFFSPFIHYPAKLSLVNNSLSGAIPNTWTNSTLLKRFHVSGNKLTGRLPNTIDDASSLRKLHLARNFLSGTIPSSYYQMQSLQGLYLDDNSLGGSLSQFYEPLYFGIREFAINNNTFEGRFPVEQFENTEILSKFIGHLWMSSQFFILCVRFHRKTHYVPMLVPQTFLHYRIMN